MTELMEILNYLDLSIYSSFFAKALAMLAVVLWAFEGVWVYIGLSLVIISVVF